MGNSNKTFGKIQILLLLLLAICFSVLPAQAKYGGGTGEPNDPYLIFDANQMNAIGADVNDWDKHFKLMADIDLSDFTGTEFNIIGIDYYNPFTGVFDGNGHAILNFSFTSTGRDYIGLFGHVGDPNTEIKDLRLIDPNVDAGNGRHFGLLVGCLQHGTIIGCCVYGGSISGEPDVGGLVGDNGGFITGSNSSASVSGVNNVAGLVGFNNGIISHCHSSGAVSGGGPVGGLVGVNVDGTITNCWSSGTVSGISQIGGGLVGANGDTIINCHSSATVSGLLVLGGLVGTNIGTITTCYTNGSVSGLGILGGLVGYNSDYKISNCYSTGSVTGDDYVGGLVGRNDGTIINCYSTGSIEGDNYVGGLVGANAATIADSFWDTNTSDVNNMCGSEGSGGSGCDNGNGESTTNMQTESTFTDVGWDFVGETANGTDDIWDICEGTNYPKFLWQIPPGDFLCPDGVNFFDYSFFAGYWAEDNCAASNDCDGRDFDQLGSVDIKDLRIFADNWLEGF